MHPLDTSANVILEGKSKSKQKNTYVEDLIAASLGVQCLSRHLDAGIMIRCLRMLCVDKDKTIRSQAFRCMRKVVMSETIANLLIETHTDVLVARALEREDRFLWERMQAMKLVKHMVDIAPGTITRSIVMALVSVSSNLDDEFGKLCLVTLREVALFNPRVVAESNSFEVLVDAILDPRCEELAPSLTFSMLYLLDKEATRRYLRPSLDLEKLICVFTNTDAPDDNNKEALKKNSTEALVILMRSWTGILMLSSDEFGLRSVIDLLKLPESVKGSTWASNAVADMLFEILEIVKVAAPNTAYGENRGATRPNLLNNYIVMVLLAFIECGLIEVLTGIGVSGTGNRDVETTATSLLSAVLNLAADLLPPSLNARLNALPSVVSLAAGFDEEKSSMRIRACNMLDDLSENSEHLSLNLVESNLTRASSTNAVVSLDDLCTTTDVNSNYRRYRRFTHSRRREHMIRSLRVFLEAQMEDIALQSLLKATQVEKSKDWTKWDTSKVMEIIEGPMRNPQHMNMLLYKTKFVKRLLSFIRPSKKAFSTIDWTTDNSKWVWVAVKLFEALSHSDEIIETPIVTDAFNEIVATVMFKLGTKTTALDPDVSWLNPINLVGTLSREYFTLIGLLSQSISGSKYLESKGFFTALSNALPDPSLDYILRLVVSNLDYGTHVLDHSDARLVLNEWLQTRSPSLQQYIITHIRLVLRASDESFLDWGLESLVIALTTSPDLARLALDVIEEVCEETNALEELIKKNPSFNMCEEAAQTLMLRFLSTPLGVESLTPNNWIGNQFKHWKDIGTTQYVEELEGALVGALSEGISSPRFAGSFARTLEEEYLFDRIHNLPWKMNITLQLGNGSEFPLPTDSQVETFTRSEGGLDVYVRATVQDTRTSLRFNQLDRKAVIKVMLNVGSQPKISPILHGQWNHVLFPKDRKMMSPDTRTVEHNNCIYEFVQDQDPEDGLVLRIRSVLIPIPAFTSGSTTVSLPPHFYGEIAKTPAGREMLENSGHFESFVRAVVDHRASSLKKRAALWTIGHIGSSETGFELLRETEIVEYISDQAKSCGTLSMRGTCFYILGLISQSPSGRELLDELGWEFPLNPALAIAVPKDISSFLKVNPSPYDGSWVSEGANGIGVGRIPWAGSKKLSSKVAKDKASSVILGHISNLGNDLLQRASHHVLLRMQQRYPEYFSSSVLLYEAAKLLSAYRFTFAVRRFVWFDLFGAVEFSPEDMLAFEDGFEKTREYISF